MEIIAARSFNTLYIYLDLIWLVFFCVLLWTTKRRLALVVGLAAGVIYFLVDYGIFYQILDTRVVTGADPFWLLLWMSFTYGVTNFAWIWLMLDRDGRTVEWSVLILGAWLTIALLSQNFGDNFATITTSRGTGTYHGVMALICFVGYLIIILHNLRGKPQDRIAILPLLGIGIGIQFGWEAALLVNGIRPTTILPLIINSLIETNLGLPYMYFIHKAISREIKADLQTRGRLIV
jgi:hypothetical protein